MRPRLTLGEPTTGEQSLPTDTALASAATLALDGTLAIPANAKISDNTPLAESTTQAVSVAMPTGEAPVPSFDAGLLREPVFSTHFGHAYPNDAGTLKELGRGGIGRVVLAFDRTIGREVAMKELLPELLADDVANGSIEVTSHTQRFLREARITGQLEHPNIVPVYELGRQQSGCLYYTMRVVRGRTLASAVKECKKLEERLALINHFAGLCQAIAYAHSRGVVHRDIKPENVMIGEFGETFVLDWGLANVVDEASPHSLRAAASLSLPPQSLRRSQALFPGTAEAFHTQMGSIVGTPHYMSPEQLLHRSDGCSPASDVWSLGVVLYTILTGNLPYDADNLGELIIKLQKGLMPAIARVEPGAPRDLAAIAARALTVDAARRYQDARAMARDIAAYQAGDKVAVYEYSSIELLRRFAHRHRSSVAVSVVSVLTLLLLGISSYRRVTSARDQAIAAERRAISGEYKAKLSLADVLFERARGEIAEGDPSSATLLAVGALELVERPDARGMLVALSNTDSIEALALPLPQPCKTIESNPQLSQFACVDGERLGLFSFKGGLATGVSLPSSVHNAYSAGAAGWIAFDSRNILTHICPNNTVTTLGSLQVPPSIVAADKQGSTFAVVDKENRIRVYSMQGSDPLATLTPVHATTALAFHPTERVLALGGYRGELSLWQWQEAQQAVSLGRSHSTVRVLTFDAKGSVLASGGSDGSVQIWDIRQRQPILLPMRGNNAVMSLSFAPNDRQLAVAMRSGVLEVLDATSTERSVRLATGYSTLTVAFATNDELVGLADESKPVRFRILTAFPKQRFISRGNVLSLSWAPNERDLMVGGLRENGLCRLDVSKGICDDRLPLRTNIVRRVVHSAEAHQFVVAGTGGKVEIWDATNNLPLGFVDVPIPEVRDLAFLSNQHRIAVVGNAPNLTIIDTDKLTISEQSPLPGPAQSLALLKSQSQLAIGLRSGSILFKSLEPGRSDVQLPLASGWPIGMAHSDARSWLVIAEDNGAVSVFDAKTKTRLGTTSTNMGRLTAFALDSVSGLIAVGGESRDVMLLSADPTPTVIARLQDHHGTVRALLFDQHNRRLYSAGDDGIIRLWPLDALRTAPATLRVAAERKFGMRVEAGRIVHNAEK